MEHETFRSRVVNLLNRSRKALRLYSNVGRLHSDAVKSTDVLKYPDGTRDTVVGQATEAQTKEWKHITSELLKDISAALDRGSSLKQLASEIYLLRDKYSSQWRSIEAEIHVQQRDLITASENGDFAKAFALSNVLMLHKARMQAAKAAHNELHEVIQRSKVTQPTIELAEDDMLNSRGFSGAGAESASADTTSADRSREPYRLVKPMAANISGVKASGARIIPLRKLL